MQMLHFERNPEQKLILVSFEYKFTNYIFFSHTQAVTIRLPDCRGQSLFGSGNNDLHNICPTGQV